MTQEREYARYRVQELERAERRNPKEVPFTMVLLRPFLEETKLNFDKILLELDLQGYTIVPLKDSAISKMLVPALLIDELYVIQRKDLCACCGGPLGH